MRQETVSKYVNQIVAYLSTNSNIGEGRTVDEIAQSLKIPKSTVYKIIRSQCRAFGVYQADSPVWPRSYYVVPEVVALQRTLNTTVDAIEKQKPAINPTILHALSLVENLLDKTTDSNLIKLQEGFDDPEKSIEKLLAVIADNRNPRSLALQGLLLISYCMDEDEH